MIERPSLSQKCSQCSFFPFIWHAEQWEGSHAIEHLMGQISLKLVLKGIKRAGCNDMKVSWMWLKIKYLECIGYDCDYNTATFYIASSNYYDFKRVFFTYKYINMIYMLCLRKLLGCTSANYFLFTLSCEAWMRSWLPFLNEQPYGYKKRAKESTLKKKCFRGPQR